MNGVDLFSGIGGISLALRDVVMPVAFSDIGANPRKVLALHHNVQLVDAKTERLREGAIPLFPTVEFTEETQNLLTKFLKEKVDIVFGGFPCQDISNAASARQGLKGTRSGLFFDMMGWVDRLKPAMVFLENVENIRTKGLDRVISELASAGYFCRWGMFTACDVGQAHQRKRWFLLAVRGEDFGRYSAEEAATPGEGHSSSSSSAPGGSGRRQPRRLEPAPDATEPNWLVEARVLGLWLTEDLAERFPFGRGEGVDAQRKEHYARAQEIGSMLGNSVVPAQVWRAFTFLAGYASPQDLPAALRGAPLTRQRIVEVIRQRFLTNMAGWKIEQKLEEAQEKDLPADGMALFVDSRYGLRKVYFAETPRAEPPDGACASSMLLPTPTCSLRPAEGTLRQIRKLCENGWLSWEDGYVFNYYYNPARAKTSFGPAFPEGSERANQMKIMEKRFKQLNGQVIRSPAFLTWIMGYPLDWFDGFNL